MLRFPKAAFVILAAAVCTAAGPRHRPLEFVGQDLTDLQHVSDYLNSIHSLRGGFLQIDPNGTLEQGTFYILKPGKMRFEYTPPNPTLVVSDGKTVAVFNKQLNTIDTYPLFATPLNILLSNEVKLWENQNVMGVTRQPGSIIVYAKSSGRQSQGDITITFSDQPLELRQWTIVDAQGLSTTVSLRNVETGMDLPPEIFNLTPTKKDKPQ